MIVTMQMTGEIWNGDGKPLLQVWPGSVVDVPSEEVARAWIEKGIAIEGGRLSDDPDWTAPFDHGGGLCPIPNIGSWHYQISIMGGEWLMPMVDPKGLDWTVIGRYRVRQSLQSKLLSFDELKKYYEDHPVASAAEGEDETPS